jgi:hypothetical protein
MARSIFGLALAALATLSLPAQAASVSANYKLAPSHAGDEDLVTAFDFYDLAVGASVIKAVAGNTGTATAPVVGDKFTGYFQSYVAGHQLGGATQSAPNLNTLGSGTGYELTLVAQFNEEITAVNAFNFTSTISGGSASLYFDTTPDHNFLTDSGFTDGDVLLTGTISTGGGVSVPQFFAGFAQIDLLVSSLAPNIFTPGITGVNGVFSLDLRSTAVNGVTSVRGQLPGSGGLILGSDGALTLRATPAPIPLPAAAWLLGSALSVLPVLRRRRVSPSLATR